MLLKRLFDIFGSLFGLIALSPILILVALLVRLRLGSPIFFRQQRPGLHAKPFDMIKFRTMSDERDDEGNPLSDEKRLTPFGDFLRKTSLDELPELFNVLKGEMSLVGPRPLLIRYEPYYTEKERRRHNVRPGMTGLAQINGRNLLPWNERLKLDVDYVDHRSFWGDVYILWRTVFKVVGRQDVVVVDRNPLQDLDVERRQGHVE